MKRRTVGGVEEGNYVVRDPAGGVMMQVTLEVARRDARLAAAIRRNGWEGIPDGPQ